MNLLCRHARLAGALQLGVLFAALPLASGCDDTGVLVSPVSSEPLQVQGGQFFAGPLPTGTGPTVDFINTSSTVFPSGAVNKTLTGDADMGATAVAPALRRSRAPATGRCRWGCPTSR